MKHYKVLYFTILSVMLSACGGPDSKSSNSSNSSQIVASKYDKSISIGWNIPTERVNGDPIAMSEISGYKIYLSKNTSAIPSLPFAIITDNSLNEYTLNNLSSGTYYISVTTFDTNGDESPNSDSISKTI